MRVTVAIPAHPARTRNGMLGRAVASVTGQTSPPAALAVALDTERRGSAATRNQALAMVLTPWVAFLDSDDELYPQHLERLAGYAQDARADLVYPWFDKVNAVDVWACREGRPFDPDVLRQWNYIAMPILVRTELIRSVGGFRADPTLNPRSASDDWGVWLRMLDAGGCFAHLPARTWRWNCHPGNTQGLPTRGDARTSAVVGDTIG